MNAEDSNIGLRAYEVIKQYIAQNKSRFVQTFVNWMTPDLSDDSIGFVIDKGYSKRKHKDAKGNVYKLLYIFPEKTMEKLLMEYGFADVKVAMKDMQKAKLLRTHEDRPEKNEYHRYILKIFGNS